MATNLRAKIGSSDKLIIHDVNQDVIQKFAKENKNVEIAQNVREIAEQSVRSSPTFTISAQKMRPFVLSMI